MLWLRAVEKTCSTPVDWEFTRLSNILQYMEWCWLVKPRNCNSALHEKFMKENSAMISAHVASKTSVIKVEGLLPLTWDLRNSHETFWWFWLISYAIGRKLSTRLTEHKRVTRNGDVNNHICERHLQTKHQIDLDSATCIMYPTDYYQRTHFRKLVQTPLIEPF